ncbi:MAG: amidohydrolase [Flavobacteriaceae bacterium]
MVLDSHQHFWKYDPERDAWIDDSMSRIRRDFLPTDLAPVLQDNGVNGCVAVQADQSEEETEFLLGIAMENVMVKGVVGWVDLLAKNVGERLAQYAQNPYFKGVRHIVQAESDDFMLRGDFQQGIAQLSQLGLTYDILVFPSQLAAAVELVQKFPYQPFVVDHMAKPYIKSGEIEGWKKDITTLAQYENVYCKISGMVTEADWGKWEPGNFLPYLDTVVEAFGVQRVMYGSDWPVCLLAAEYREQLQLISSYVTSFSQSERKAVMGENAKEFYNIKENGRDYE